MGSVTGHVCQHYTQVRGNMDYKSKYETFTEPTSVTHVLINFNCNLLITLV